MYTFADPLKRGVQIAAKATVVIDGDKLFTYTDLHERCARLGGGLRALGLARGDRVAILAAKYEQSPCRNREPAKFSSASCALRFGKGKGVAFTERTPIAG